MEEKQVETQETENRYTQAEWLHILRGEIEKEKLVILPKQFLAIFVITCMLFGRILSQIFDRR